ncbi:hypothetical protein H6P81_013879 [Aristolochia fimbriata]|uniref:Uncharacterized protein n=1 Tax=Aristolochia fimbriata TaxID=158543 RepID=A0AAV7EJ86_ARIFI|nr:hypothetical protein H6P81_013879 [Aristolochia fimbriata]
MFKVEGDESRERAQAHVQLWHDMLSFVYPVSLKCAVELGIPDIIHKLGPPINLPTLAAAIPIPVNKIDHLHRLMRLLVHTGIFSVIQASEKQPGSSSSDDEEKEGLYALTPFSRLLVKDNKDSHSPHLKLMNPTMINPWLFLSRWFKGEAGSCASSNPFELCHGCTLYEYANRCPELNGIFNEAMACDSRFLLRTLVTECAPVFDGLKSLVDVGGGTGVAATALAEAFPNLQKITVLDLPHVVADSVAPADSALDFIGGDMFRWIPPADTVFLKMILHNWDDAECVRILKKCKEAIPRREEGGKVIIVDMVLNSNRGDHLFTETQLFSDLLMCVNLTGKEREEAQWKKIFEDSGFSHYNIVPVPALCSVIEVFP